MSTPSPDLAPREPGRDRLIKGHQYDGITEYDNPMPGWWVWSFWASIAFAVVYTLGVHVFGFINSYQDDLAAGLQELEVQRAAYAEVHGGAEVDEAALAAAAADPARASAGAATFAQFCAACHGDQGQGMIGPNLTDAYWLHGHTDRDVYDAITGGVADKGMPAWGSLSNDQRLELLAFIRSLEGSDPPGAREPQGEPAG